MPALLQVADQRRAGLVGLAAELADAAGQAAVMVPAGMIELDEPDVALGQAAGQQAVGGERPRLPRIGAVELEDVVGLIRDPRHLGDGGLHPVGHLVLGDPGLDRRVERRVVLDLVQLAEPVEHLAAAGRRDARRVLEVEHRIGPRAELDPLMDRRQEPVAPEPGVQRLVGPLLADQHAERRQVAGWSSPGRSSATTPSTAGRRSSSRSGRT